MEPEQKPDQPALSITAGPVTASLDRVSYRYETGLVSFTVDPSAPPSEVDQFQQLALERIFDAVPLERIQNLALRTADLRATQPARVEAKRSEHAGVLHAHAWHQGSWAPADLHLYRRNPLSPDHSVDLEVATDRPDAVDRHRGTHVAREVFELVGRRQLRPASGDLIEAVMSQASHDPLLAWPFFGSSPGSVVDRFTHYEALFAIVSDYGELAGWIGATRASLHWHRMDLEIGIFAKHRRSGIARYAVWGMLAHLFANYPILKVSVDIVRAPNDPLVAALDRLLPVEAIRPAWKMRDGLLCDEISFGLLRAEALALGEAILRDPSVFVPPGRPAPDLAPG